LRTLQGRSQATVQSTTGSPVGNPQGFFGLLAAAATYWAISYFDGQGFRAFVLPFGAVSLGSPITQIVASGLAFLAPSLVSSLASTPLVSSILDFFSGSSTTSQLSSIQSDTKAIRTKLGA
jgi:hypothetical protein